MIYCEAELSNGGSFEGKSTTELETKISDFYSDGLPYDIEAVVVHQNDQQHYLPQTDVAKIQWNVEIKIEENRLDGEYQRDHERGLGRA